MVTPMDLEWTTLKPNLRCISYRVDLLCFYLGCHLKSAHKFQLEIASQKENQVLRKKKKLCKVRKFR